MLRIGEFSKLAKISIKALRYYDKIGLFPADRVDEDSGYRYYRPERIRDFETIIELHRSPSGFSPYMLEQMFTPDEVGRLQRMEQGRRALTENGTSVFRAAIATLKDARSRRTDNASDDVVSSIASILARKSKK